jgi:hypothetical protein
MTPLHTYAQLRLDEYLHYPTAQAEAVRHYLGIIMECKLKEEEERKRIEQTDRL